MYSQKEKKKQNTPNNKQLHVCLQQQDVQENQQTMLCPDSGAS